MSVRSVTIGSPIGPIGIIGDGETITEVHLGAGDDGTGDVSTRDAGVFRDAVAQVQAYFAGGLTRFDLPLDARGTPFQRAVWTALMTIPFGETRSYAQIAASIDAPNAARAVGMANARNPIAIVIPCHRVIGASGALTGYAAGVDRKRWLLDHEAEPHRAAQLAGASSESRVTVSAAGRSGTRPSSEESLLTTR